MPLSYSWHQTHPPSSIIINCNNLGKFSCLQQTWLLQLLVLWHPSKRSKQTSNNSKLSCARHHLAYYTPKRDHIKPVLEKLHWLPIKQRIDYKICLLTYKSLHLNQPVYLRKTLSFPSHNISTRSTDSAALFPKQAKTSFGNRGFSVAAPRLWNSLPSEVRSALPISSFRSKLKTHLFKEAFHVP